MQDTLTNRPTDCACWGQDGLACFECWRAGFETPNPNPSKEDTGE
jgi:hypothetical protein